MGLAVRAVSSTAVIASAKTASLACGWRHHRRTARTPFMHVSAGIPGPEVALPGLIIWLLSREYAGRAGWHNSPLAWMRPREDCGL